MKQVKNMYDKIVSNNGVILLYLSILICVVVLLWNKILNIFKPVQDATREASQITTKSNNYYKKGAISADGYFLNGLGQKTKYVVSQAKQNAESLSALLNTYKGASWFKVSLSFFGFGAVARIKAILNPNYPASYRRYVEEVYRDVFTDNKILQVDVRNALTGFAGSSWWTNDLTKYFQ